MRKLVVSAVLAALVFPAAAAVTLAQKAPAVIVQESLADRRKDLNDLINEYWQAYLQANPEFASAIGDKRWNDKLSDYSVQANNDWLQREQAWLLRIAAIDPTGFTDQEKISRELLLRKFTDDEEGAQFKVWEMPVNQMAGIQIDYQQLVAQLPFQTVKDYEDWIARLNALPTAFEQVSTNMSIGMEDKRVPPKYLLEKVDAQVKTFLAEKPEDTPYALPLKHFPASIPAAEQQSIKSAMLDAIQHKVFPAYVRFGRFLEASYIPAGRTDPGLWALPDGQAYYQYLLDRTTTTQMTAEQIHQIGLEQVAKDEKEMLAIAQKLGFKDLATFRASLKDNPRLHPTSRDQLLDAYRGYLSAMQAKLPELFGRLPKAKFEVVPVPAFLEKTSAPAYYEPGTADGSRPGRLFIDLYDPTQRNLYSVESIAYHEGLPGHHLQISIARELTDVPEFRKYSHYTAYTEGWGLYAEQLGKDVGFYQDPYSDYGRLEADIWRAIRLVVDTGVHSQHWTRQQMVDYFHAHSAIAEPDVQSEVDRYIAWPSQATAYKIGQLTIIALREKAKKELGPKFDIRAFHDEVLDSGALPLDMLADRVDAWINSQKAN
ncbi:MAG: DUF885 domain-containing protein [Acidobacteriota bacterium]|nr:DUF885 domain-containing protein [Acidobacteriota bacterium]